MNVPRFAVRHKSVVWIIVLLMTAWGAFNYATISRREDPEIKISIALVVTIWPGAGAEKVERLVTRKLEDQIEQMSVLEKVTSTSRENLSVILVEVKFDTDVAMAWQVLRNKLAEIRGDLPDGIIGPDVKDDFGDVTAMIWSLSSPTAEPRDLEHWADELKAEFRKVTSVGKVELVGVQDEVIYIEGPLESFTMYDFSPFVAAVGLDAFNVNMPSGYLRAPDRNLRLDTTGSFTVLDDLREAVLDVSRETGHPLKVRDVFTVRRGYAEPPLDVMLTNGEPSVGLDLRMKAGYNIVAMGEEVRAVAEAFRQRLPEDIHLSLVHDQPHQVDRFVDTFLENLAEGLAIVIIVMFLAMGLRTTAIVAISLPLSIIFTFALMPALDIDLETVSIASFIVALGMLVDNAIIVVDNVDRHLEQGTERKKAAWLGAHELIGPVISGTLATAVAFLPLLLLKDEQGAYVRALPLVVTISLAMSLLLAVTLTPILSAIILRRSRRKAGATDRPRWTMRAYAAFMRVGMKLRYLVILLALAGFAGAVMLLPEVGMSYFPESDRDQFTIDIWLPEGASLEATGAVVEEVQRYLDAEPEVESHVAYLGKGGPRFFISIKPEFNATNYAQIVVNTRDPMATRPLVARLSPVFRSEIPGARVLAANLLMGVPVEAPIAIRVTGPNLGVMRGISQQIQDILRDTPGTDGVRDNLGEEVPSIRVDVDSEAAAMFGISSTEVAATLLTAFEGLPVTQFRAGKDEIPIKMRLRDPDRRSVGSLHQLAVPSQLTGAKVPLSAMADLQPSWAPGIIKRYNNRRAVTVLSNVHGRLADEVMRDAWPRIDKISLPPGYALESSGEEAERNKAFGELLMIFGLIIGLLVLMLTIQFSSIKRALAILMTVPLAIIGAILGLYFSGNSFSFMAFLGVISLAGIVIKNAVVWVEFVDKSLAQGNPLSAAIIEAGRYRLRPILLTAATTIGGLVPLAIFGGVLWEGMAWAMIVGLALATVLTLVVNPIIYYSLFRRQYRARAAA